MNKCAMCGREFEGAEGMINDKPYCHPSNSTGETCYMKQVRKWR